MLRTYDDWKTTDPRDAQPDYHGGEDYFLDDTRIVCCSECGGDGAFEMPPARPGEIIPAVMTCRACAGVGEVEVEVKPVERDDYLEEGER